jgi:hypothetical protein
MPKDQGLIKFLTEDLHYGGPLLLIELMFILVSKSN